MKYILYVAVFIATTTVSTAQVGLGTFAPNKNAVLEVNSTTQGMAFPRVSAMTDIPNPATGLMVYDMDEDCLAVNVGTPAAPDWKCTGSATTVVDVAGQNGTIWMDRNLGATQQATSSTDTAAYGDLYQWGRSEDGHQIRTSATTSSQSTTSTPAHGDFIFGSTDWLTSQDDTLWQAGNNDPCPSGYRIPTETELNNERLVFSVNTSVGAFNSALKFPVAGYRNVSSGRLSNVGSSGAYWSSTVSGTNARGLGFTSSNASMNSFNRANGCSVRCIKE